MGKYVILGMPRTGSTLLNTGLTQHPNICAFGELLHRDLEQRRQVHNVKRNGQTVYFDAASDDAITFLKEHVYDYASNFEAIGFKLFGEHVECPGTTRLFSRLLANIDQLKIIHIVRSNYLDVFVSRRMAERTKEWVRFSGTAPDPSFSAATIDADPERAVKFFETMLEFDKFIESLGKVAPYYRVDYEALTADYEGVMSSVYKFVGASNFKARAYTQRQIERPISQVVQNYENLRSRVAGTRWECFLSGDRKAVWFPNSSTMTIDKYAFDLDSSSAVKNKRSAGNNFILMKRKRLIDEYRRLISAIAPQNIFELGVRRGGSAVFFNLIAKPKKHVAIEIETEVIGPLADFAKEVQQDERLLSINYGVDQSDREKLKDLVRGVFGSDGARPLDFVVDDASHKLDLSRASFEALFPFVRSGGVYALEDWGWAHWTEFQGKKAYFSNEPALSNLVFELCILHTCRPDIIQEIRITPVVVFLTRGDAVLDVDRFRVRDLLVMRGRQLGRI